MKRSREKSRWRKIIGHWLERGRIAEGALCSWDGIWWPTARYEETVREKRVETLGGEVERGESGEGLQAKEESQDSQKVQEVQDSEAGPLRRFCRLASAQALALPWAAALVASAPRGLQSNVSRTGPNLGRCPHSQVPSGVLRLKLDGTC